MLVINMYGGPGAGKTTVAMGLFGFMRNTMDVNIEFVGEFATELCFEQAKANLKDQLYLIGNQWHKLWRLQQIGVDIVITDSSLSLAPIYAKMHNIPYAPKLEDLVASLRQEHTNLDVLIKRSTNPVYLDRGPYKGNTGFAKPQYMKRLDLLIAGHRSFDVCIEYKEHHERTKMMNTTSGHVFAYLEPKINAYLDGNCAGWRINEPGNTLHDEDEKVVQDAE